jgi:branched-chain amino acid transport system permease protein
MLLFEQLVSGIAIGSIYSLLGLGFTMIFASTKRINFAHGDMMALGGLLGLVYLRLLPQAPLLGYLLGALSIGVASAGIERALLRPLQDMQPLKFVIATIGLSIVLKIVMKQIWGSDALGYPQPVPPEPLEVLGARVAPQNLLILLVALVLMGLLQAFFLFSRPGRSLRALAMDRYAARLMGVDVGRSISLTYFLSGLMAGIAGMLIGPVFFVSSNMGTTLGLKSFVAAVIGGLGNIPGTIAGGLLLGVAENLSAGFISSAYKNAISLLFLVLVLLLRPQGLLSGFKRKLRRGVLSGQAAEGKAAPERRPQ